MAGGPLGWLPAEVALVVLAVGIGAVVWLVLNRGRDRRFAGQVPGLEPMDGSAHERLPVVGLPPIAVDFVPQPGIRPAEWGVLLRERVMVDHITATIVDLAVRGHLRLEAVERSRRLRRAEVDWVIHRSADGEARGDAVDDYERTLLNVLLRGAESVPASSLREGFVGSLLPVRSELYERMRGRGWFLDRPDSARAVWSRVGWSVLVPAFIVWLVLLAFSPWWPVALAVGVIGLALVVAARWMPARTAKGHAAKVRAEGFALYLRTAEVERIAAEERLGVFTRYLPYAIVLGAAGHWASVFGDTVVAGLAKGKGLDWLTVPDLGLDGSDLLPDLGSDLVSGVSSGIQDAVDGMAGLGDGGLGAVFDGLSGVLDGLDLLP